jgi:hypothetical protein
MSDEQALYDAMADKLVQRHREEVRKLRATVDALAAELATARAERVAGASSYCTCGATPGTPHLRGCQADPAGPLPTTGMAGAAGPYRRTCGGPCLHPPASAPVASSGAPAMATSFIVGDHPTCQACESLVLPDGSCVNGCAPVASSPPPDTTTGVPVRAGDCFCKPGVCLDPERCPRSRTPGFDLMAEIKRRMAELSTGVPPAETGMRPGQWCTGSDAGHEGHTHRGPHRFVAEEDALWRDDPASFTYPRCTYVQPPAETGSAATVCATCGGRGVVDVKPGVEFPCGGWNGCNCSKKCQDCGGTGRTPPASSASAPTTGGKGTR